MSKLKGYECSECCEQLEGELKGDLYYCPCGNIDDLEIRKEVKE